MRRRLAAALSVILGLSFAVAVPAVASAEPVQTPSVVINEVTSQGQPEDWVELYNAGATDVDISGWMVRDNAPTALAPLPAGTIVPAGGYLVLEGGTDFAFGLGKGDEFHLYLADGVTLVDETGWAAGTHADPSWGRCADGKGEFTLNESATPGEANDCPPTAGPENITINEVTSQGVPQDWVELHNDGITDVDISGWMVRDNDPTALAPLPAGTIVPAGGYLVLEGGTDFAFGLGKGDEFHLYLADGATLVDETGWAAGTHADPSWGRCPDVTGEFEITAAATPGTANGCVLPAGADGIVLNEVSSDPSDWAEIFNAGDADVDLSGWFVSDDGGTAGAEALPAGTVVPAEGYLVLAKDTHFSFGLGKGDQFHLYLADGVTVVDETTWTAGAHATPSWGRCPDGAGEFAMTASATPGEPNDCATGNVADLVLNEVESSAADNGSDWIELHNPTSVEIDATGMVAKDSGEGNNVTLPAGSNVPAGGYLTVDVTGLGSSDAARLFAADGTTLIDETSWSAHADETWGRCPDGTGAFGETEGATPGAANLCPPPAGWDRVVINEIESSGGDPGDWVELYNTGEVAVDLTGWILKDNNDSHALTLESGTTIEAGGFVVIYTDQPAGGFGLGNPDEPRLFLPDGTTLVDSYAYTEHAPSTTYGRCPDGTGEFVETFASTPGAANDCSPVRINEVDSMGADPVDWVELTNAGSEAIDVSGYMLRDNKDTSEIVIASGTTIEPGAYLAVDVDIDGGFGLGAADAARLFAADGVTLLDSTTWTEHAATSWARCPDGIGAFEVSQSATKGEANDCVGMVGVSAWPGDAGVSSVSAVNAYGGDMSGLAYEATGVGRGTLWAVNNGSGVLYQLLWDATAGQWVPASADGWSAGKTLRYPGGAGEVDAEGVGLVAGSAANGIYVATERDNAASSISRPSVLLFDVSASGTELTATTEWNLASILPALPANGGLEGIAWIPDADLTAQGFIDESTDAAYDPADYAGHGNGLFFVGVEGTARIYAVALQDGGVARLVATIDPKLAMVAEVAYDAASGLLYAVCDDACDGEIHAMAITQNGPSMGSFQNVASYANPAGMADNIANEGFAIGTCENGVAPVFYADDNETDGISLREGRMYCGAYHGGDDVLLNLLNINDFHGRIDANTVKVAGTIEQLRAAYGEDNTLFLSAGDNIGASLFASAYADDKPTIDVLNTLGLAASAVGNHEFDKGSADLLGRVSSAAQFPYLGANVYAKGTQDPVLPEYATFDVDGLTVAVVGAITQETPSLVSPGGIASLEFGDPVDAVNRVAAQLTDGDEGNGEADVIIAEYHEGSVDGVKEGASIDDEIAAGGAFAKIVTETSAAVDAIFTGHTHKEYAWDGPIPGEEGTRPVLQTGSYGENIGQVRLWIDPATGMVNDYDVRNVARTTSADATLTAAYPRVAAVKTIVDAALADAAEVGNEPVGSVTADITTAFAGGSFVDGTWTGGARDNRAVQSTLGNLVADSLVASLSAPERGGAEIGLVNPGGLRNELYYGADGLITYAEANAVLPFVNNLWTTTLTGEQFKAVLEQQWQPEGASRPYLQLGVSENVFYTYDASQPRGERITGIWIDGEPIVMDAEYRVGSFSFLLQGGDNFTVLAEGSDTRDSGLIDRDAWIDYITDNSPLEPDFASRSAQITGLPDMIERGATASLTVSGVNLSSLGAPENTTALVSFVGSAAVFDPVPVANGMASIEVTVPTDAADASEIIVNFEPSGTEARGAASVVGEVTTEPTPTPTPTPSGTPSPTPTQSAEPTQAPAPLPSTGGANPPDEKELTPETQGAIQPQGGTSFEQGQTVTITVGTQYAGQTVEGWIFSTPTYLGTSVVSAAGTATFTIPANLPVGTHRLVVTDSAGTVIGWTYVQVEALAATGGTAESTGAPLLPWAAALILLGGALVVIRPRRQRKA
jgi:2',3'-cyclic-nucleotide 2'-phosphodiesterase (5'-nucleotidase family)